VRKVRALDADERVALERLRRIVRSLDGSVETLSFGHPAFKVAGNTYAVLDRYGGGKCLWLRVDPMDRADRLAEPGWFASPYDPRRTALCCRLEAIDWRRMGARVRSSYALAALKVARRKR